MDIQPSPVPRPEPAAAGWPAWSPPPSACSWLVGLPSRPGGLADAGGGLALDLTHRPAPPRPRRRTPHRRRRRPPRRHPTPSRSGCIPPRSGRRPRPASTEPVSGTDRFAQNRRVTTATYHFGSAPPVAGARASEAVKTIAKAGPTPARSGSRQ